jgi:hypothetical protein
MSVIPVDLSPTPANRSARRRRFWHRLGEQLDALVAYPTKHAVSEQELRRVDDDIKRCRQLMVKKPQQRHDARLDRVSMPSSVRAIKAR